MGLLTPQGIPCVPWSKFYIGTTEGKVALVFVTLDKEELGFVLELVNADLLIDCLLHVVHKLENEA